MKSIRLTLFLTLISVISLDYLSAQGCVAVRQMGGNNMFSSNSYNLSKGEIQVGAAYRYFHSWRHFVGTEEQHERQTTGGGHDIFGKELGNAVNIYSNAVDFNFSIGLSDRFQLNATIPFVHNERSQILRQTKPLVDTFRYSVFASGLADVRISANYWVFNPLTAQKGNLMVGLGVKLPTGSYTETDEAPQANGTIKTGVMDQAIQPGDGGTGISVEIQGFKKIYKKVFGFVNGYYLFNPKETNGSFKSAPAVGLEGYNLYAAPDQYFARAGFMGSLDKANNFGISLAGRLEGIPAYDAFGGQVAYRRPGYVVAIEPGVTIRSKNHSFSLLVPFNLVRDRIQSAADIARQDLENAEITDPAQKVHIQGDAAFADYSLNFTYTYRFGGKNTEHKMTE